MYVNWLLGSLATLLYCVGCVASVVNHRYEMMWTRLDEAKRDIFVIYFNNQLNAQFLYSITICMLHYNPRHVSSINMPIFRRTNFITTASGIVTLCKRLYSMPDESRLHCSLLSSGILYYNVQRVTMPDAVIIKFVLLKMGMLMLETCRGL